MRLRLIHVLPLLLLFVLRADARAPQTAGRGSSGFEIQEATIAQIQQAIFKGAVGMETLRGLDTAEGRDTAIFDR